MPFYRALAEQAQNAGTRIVAATKEAPAANSAYLKGNGIPFEAVVSADECHLTVRATPMVLVVKSDGAVIGSWLGKLDGKGEREVLRAVRGS